MQDVEVVREEKEGTRLSSSSTQTRKKGSDSPQTPSNHSVPP